MVELPRDEQMMGGRAFFDQGSTFFCLKRSPFSAQGAIDERMSSEGSNMKPPRG